MTETALVQRFAKARGLTMCGTMSKAGARGVLLPLLILDICYRYVSRLNPDDFRFKQRHIVKEIRKAYNHVNGWFFAGLKDQLEDAAIDLMDDLEKRLDLDILICDTAVWNIMKIFPEPLCGQLVACYMAHVLSSAANGVWGEVFQSARGERTHNKDMIKIASETRRLAYELMGRGPHESPDRLIEGLRAAESALGRKLGRWTREDDDNGNKTDNHD